MIESLARGFLHASVGEAGRLHKSPMRASDTLDVRERVGVEEAQIALAVDAKSGP